MLGSIDMRMGGMSMPEYSPHNPLPRIDWVIVGGESGKDARQFNVSWARAIVQQCAAAGVPVFVKQLGVYTVDVNDAGFEGDTPMSWPMDTRTRDEDVGGYQGAPVRVFLKRKGGDPAQWPADLRVRQFPEVRV